MQLVSFQYQHTDRLGLVVNNTVYPITTLDNELPDNMKDFLWAGDWAMQRAKELDQQVKDEKINPADGQSLDSIELLAPVPRPTTVRDAYAFRQHVATARQNRGAEMPPEFDQFPVFYYTNSRSVFGPGPITCMPDHFQKLDYELEVAVVLGQQGKNIRAAEADDYIAGYMIMNDLSARQLQKEEMKLHLGPAKGKDFANVFGPMLVTPDELESHRAEPKSGHTGNIYDLSMKARLNGEQLSEGNLAEMDWTFAEIIERISYGTEVYPGEVIGSGTVGTGCLLEVNGTRQRQNPDYEPRWLQDGDEVELEVEGLGVLTNTLRQADTDYSILDLKKTMQESE